jgi:hypothetical protein
MEMEPVEVNWMNLHATIRSTLRANERVIS